MLPTYSTETTYRYQYSPEYTTQPTVSSTVQQCIHFVQHSYHHLISHWIIVWSGRVRLGALCLSHRDCIGLETGVHNLYLYIRHSVSQISAQVKAWLMICLLSSGIAHSKAKTYNYLLGSSKCSYPAKPLLIACLFWLKDFKNMSCLLWCHGWWSHSFCKLTSFTSAFRLPKIYSRQ